MKWKKYGIIFKPDGALSSALSHAMAPTPIRLSDKIIRVFFTSRDINGIGRPHYFDVLASDLTQVVSVSNGPVMDVGIDGSFDENGVIFCSVINHGDNNLWAYYAGFELGTKIRYRLLSGMARSTDGGNTFKRTSSVPLLERSPQELYFRGGPFCMLENGKFRLWYAAGSSWESIRGKQMPCYNIHYLESNDGIGWGGQGAPQISAELPDEHGFGRPFVIYDNSHKYRMFYSIRKRSARSYSMGYAESSDGYVWTRRDENLNLNVSETGFDSEQIMYAAPVIVNGELFVFYNGNEFGVDGCALAVLESE